MDKNINPLKDDASAVLFLKEYWQKKPCLIRNALPDFVSPYGMGELAGLACDEEVESRLIQHDENENSWHLSTGPFEPEDFSTLQDTHWTLLIQEANKHLPVACEVLDKFRFIPDWRIDDLMISVSPAQGSVGAHVDSYDVFLIQAEGERDWSIARPGSFNPELRDDTDLSLLADYTPELQWRLQAGDILYLPPGYAHHGIAINQCQTWSVGFRAPSTSDISMAMSDYFASDEHRYSDPDLALQSENPAEITPAVLQNMQTMLKYMSSSSLLPEWFGCMVTENRAGLYPEVAENPLSFEDFRSVLKQGKKLQKHCRSRFAYYDHSNRTYLFVDGVCSKFSLDNLSTIAALCNQDIIENGSEHAELFYPLYCEGHLVISNV